MSNKSMHLPTGCIASIPDPVRRLKRLEDSRLNLQMAVLTMLDQIGIIEDEITALTGVVNPIEHEALEDIATYEREEAEGLK